MRIEGDYLTWGFMPPAGRPDWPAYPDEFSPETKAELEALSVDVDEGAMTDASMPWG